MWFTVRLKSKYALMPVDVWIAVNMSLRSFCKGWPGCLFLLGLLGLGSGLGGFSRVGWSIQVSMAWAADMAKIDEVGLGSSG